METKYLSYDIIDSSITISYILTRISFDTDSTRIRQYLLSHQNVFLTSILSLNLLHVTSSGFSLDFGCTFFLFLSLIFLSLFSLRHLILTASLPQIIFSPKTQFLDLFFIFSPSTRIWIYFSFHLVGCLYFLFVISFKDGMMGLIEEFCYY